MSRKREQPPLLENIVRIIVEEARPEQVVLFGSRAKGAAQGKSDYDFLVVVHDVQNERDISRRIYRALLEQRVGVAVDIVVVNAGTLDRHKESPFFVYRQALREGKVFYDRAGVCRLAAQSGE